MDVFAEVARTLIRSRRLLLAALALQACSEPARRLPLVEHDSAGIRIIENHSPAWRDGDGWTIDTVPALDTGTNPENPASQLYAVGDVVGATGFIAVADVGASQIVLFDFGGNVIDRIGRRGSGPSEFSQLRGLYRCAGDTLIVNDFSRVMTVAPEGRFIRAQPVRQAEGERTARVQGVTSDCSTFIISAGTVPQAMTDTPFRRESRFLRGDLDGTERSSLATVRGREVETHLVEDVPQPVPVPWGADGVWAIDGDRFYYGSTDQPEIHVYERDGGLRRIVRWTRQVSPVTDADRELYEDRRAWLLTAFPSAIHAAPPLDAYGNRPSRKPFFIDALPDDEGNLWIRTYPSHIAGRPDLFGRDVPLRYTPPPANEPERWEVFDSTGRWLGEVQTPPNLAVRAIARDMVLGVWKDSLDVEHVRGYRIRRR